MKNSDIKGRLIQAAIEGMQDKKASDISLINLTKLGSSAADYFIIATGQTFIQTEAIAWGVLEKTYSLVQQRPWKKEGFANKEWIILDYSDIVVHILKKEQRELYDLESLWGNAIITHP